MMSLQTSSRGTSLPTGIALASILLSSPPGMAQERHCQGELRNVQREVTAPPLSTEKGAQIDALMQQVVRACKENDDVVAMAGLDQVRAILSEARNPESRS